MHLSAIAIYPVKSCRAVALEAAAVEPLGLAGDRRWLLVDADGRFVTQREEPRLATVEVAGTRDGLVIHAEGRRIEVPIPPAATGATEVTIWRDTVPALPTESRIFGLRLVYLADPQARRVNPAYGMPADRVSFADGYPLLLASEASLADLGARMPAPLPMNRFRPSVVVAGAPPWAEDRWRRIRIGGVRFRIAKPCDRCIVTTTDQMTGARGAAAGEPLRTLATFRRRGSGVFFGQNMIPDDTGPIRLGDPVEVLEESATANWVI
jgi:uncharacterized protein YcbX